MARRPEPAEDFGIGPRTTAVGRISGCQKIVILLVGNVGSGTTNQPPMPGDFRGGVYVVVCLGGDEVGNSSVVIAEDLVAPKEFPGKARPV